jgi:hypothetical protein
LRVFDARDLLLGEIGRHEERRELLAMVKKQVRSTVSLLSHPDIMPLEPVPERKRALVLEPIQHRKRGIEQFPGHLQSFNRSPSKLHKSRRPRTDGNGQRRAVRRKPETAPSGGFSVSSCTETESPSSFEFAEGNMYGDSEDLGIESLTVNTETEDETYQCFISLVDDNYLGFIDISSSLYMVQGFDLSRKEGTVSMVILGTNNE